MADTLIHSDILRDLRVKRGTGLTVGVQAGNYNVSGTVGYFAGATNQAVANNATNYVQLDSSGALVVNTTGFLTSNIPLATVVTSGGVVTAVNDFRSIIGNHGAGTGTGIWRKGVPSGTVDGTNDTFTLPTTPDPNSLLLILDGNLLDEGGSDDYTLSGSTVVFTTPPEVGSKLIYLYTESTPQSPAPADALKTSGSPVNIGTSLPPSGADEILSSDDPTTATWKPNYSLGIKITGGEVDTTGSGVPTIGQVLTATSASTAEFQTLVDKGIYLEEGNASWSNSNANTTFPSTGVVDATAKVFKLVFNIKNESGVNPCTLSMRVNGKTGNVYDYIKEAMPSTKTADTAQSLFELAIIPAGLSLVGEMTLRQKDNNSFVAIQSSLAVSSVSAGEVMTSGRVGIDGDAALTTFTFIPSQSITGNIYFYKLV